MWLKRRKARHTATAELPKPPPAPRRLDDMVVLSGSDSRATLTWEERVDQPRDVTREPSVLDIAYRTARCLLDDGAGTITIHVRPNGRLASATANGKHRGGLFRLAIIGVNREAARSWAGVRLGATAWERIADDIEVADLDAVP